MVKNNTKINEFQILFWSEDMCKDVKDDKQINRQQYRMKTFCYKHMYMEGVEDRLRKCWSKG